MSNVSTDEFRRSLEQLVQQAQHTAQLGVNVAREQVEGLIKTPPQMGPVGDQFDELRRNLQTMARDMEAKAQELVHLASSYMQPGAAPTSRARTTVTTEPPAAHESATAAGAGTSQGGSDHTGTSHTPAGEAPQQ